MALSDTPPLGGAASTNIGADGTSSDLSRIWKTATAFMCIAALLLATRPYRGIVHDALLYTVQALHRIDPQAFSEDIFFASGSQHSFTLFDTFYSPLVAGFGPGTAHGLAAVLGFLCWVPALIWMTRCLFGPGRTSLLATAAVIVLNPNYGALGVFSYGEPFVTPRLFAEAFVMAALGAALCQRIWISVVTLAIAMVIHPLMVLPGIVVVVFLIIPQHRGLYIAIAGMALGGVALTVYGVEPFSRAMLRYDETWFAIVKERSDFALLSEWGWRSIAESTLPFTALLIAFKFGSPTQHRLIRAILFAVLLGLTITFLGGDIIHNILVVNLQLWRALWILTLIGNAWSVIVVLHLAAGSIVREVYIIALLLNILEHWLSIPPFCSALVAGIAFFMFIYEQRLDKKPSPFLRVVCRALALLGILGRLVAMADRFKE